MNQATSVTVLVDLVGAPKHPDDGPGRWYKARLVDLEGGTIEAQGETPAKASDIAWVAYNMRLGKQVDVQPAGKADPASAYEKGRHEATAAILRNLPAAIETALVVHETAMQMNRDEGLTIFDPAAAPAAMTAAIVEALGRVGRG